MGHAKITILTAALIALALLAAGCATQVTVATSTEAQNRGACGGDGCHDEVVTAQVAGSHSGLACVQCHEGTGDDHAADPATAVASTDWTIDACANCHDGEAATYLYDDNRQVGPFGGSQRHPEQHKTDAFPEYNTIVAGHGFTRDYAEEGAHRYMLEDHYRTLRGKFESCVQCKSTKVAYVWGTDKPLRVAADTEITLTHTVTDTEPAKKVTIPKGTTVKYATDDDHSVNAQATFPDGTVWTSKPLGDADEATRHYNMVWASTMAAIDETRPYGAGCNHCHDPHSGGQRLVRKAMLDAIEERGVNPYAQTKQTDWTKAGSRDRQTLMCAQCHVEYVCGKSGVDGVDRDYFSWAKAKDLHDLYDGTFGYAQDWTHSIIGQPLIKSQHPETELYWQSPHYNAGASCASCHMPQVTDSKGRKFRSHWMTSPYKYSDKDTWTAFAEETGLRQTNSNPCTRCHSDRTARGIGQQETFYERQAEIEKLLAESVALLGRVKEAKDAGGKVDEARYAKAVAAHRQAHVLWENIAVSENSMGFHNFDEAMVAMDDAEKHVRTAIGEAKELAK